MLPIPNKFDNFLHLFNIRPLPFFFFNDTATTEIYTLSLHDALPISRPSPGASSSRGRDPRLRRYSARPAGGRRRTEIGRAHVWTPVTVQSRIPSSACYRQHLPNESRLSARRIHVDTSHATTPPLSMT